MSVRPSDWTPHLIRFSIVPRTRKTCAVSVIVIPVDREQRVGGYESWWDVPVAEVSPISDVQRARGEYEEGRRKVRTYL